MTRFSSSLLALLLALTLAAPAMAQEEDQVEQVPLSAPAGTPDSATKNTGIPDANAAAAQPAPDAALDTAPAAEPAAPIKAPEAKAPEAKAPAEKAAEIKKPDAVAKTPDAANKIPAAAASGKKDPDAAEQSPVEAPPADAGAAGTVDGKKVDTVTAPAEAPPDAELPPLTEMPKAEMEEMPIGVLRSIDKLSTRAHTFDLPVDKTVKFGSSLFIKLRACRKSSPISQPESAAFVQIWERKPHENESHWIFSGWMFSSNPSLSAMDHPVYDVWLIECKNNSTVSKSENFSAETAPAKAPEKEDKPAAPGDKSTAAPGAGKVDKNSGEKSDKPAASPIKQTGDDKPSDALPASPTEAPPVDTESSE